LEEMSEWLAIWGAMQAAGLVVKPILEEFAKDTGKDFAKDFFKDALKKVIHLPEPNILQRSLWQSSQGIFATDGARIHQC
jgi:hypothetical protein